MKLFLIFFNLLLFGATLDAQANQELMSCTDQKTSAKLLLTYDFNKKSFTVTGMATRTPGQGEKPKLQSLNESFPIYADSSFSAFPGYDPRGGHVCKLISLSVLNPDNADWKKCHEGYSQLEWIGKYTAGKAGKINRKNDKKLIEYRNLIDKYCRQFDGKISGVWISIPNGEKVCDRIGMNVNEFAMPFMGMPLYRLESLIQNPISVSCKYDIEAIIKITKEFKKGSDAGN